MNSTLIGTKEYLVVVFDICSSTTILENLTLSGDKELWCEILVGLQRYLRNQRSKLHYKIYNFIGDGWILLFPTDIRGDILIPFLKGLSDEYYTLYKRILHPILSVTPQQIGLTFGVDSGILYMMKMDKRTEYAGISLNIASRLQGSIGQKDRNPANKVLTSKRVYKTMAKYIRANYVVKKAERKLRNVMGGEKFLCRKISLFKKPTNTK